MSKKETAALLFFLQQACRYSPDTGEMWWVKSKFMTPQWNNKYAGKEAFTHTVKDGRQDGKFMQVKLEKSRVAWALHYGSWPKGVVDHIDQCPAHNWITNLRDTTQGMNMLNKRLAKNNTSGASGVHFKDGKWSAMVNLNRKQRWLGSFESKEEAMEARKDWFRSRGVSILDGEHIA